VLAAAAQAADPDLALAGLAQIAERDPGLIRTLSADPRILGAAVGRPRLSARPWPTTWSATPRTSPCLRGPEASRRLDAKAVRAEFLRAVAADPDDPEPAAGQAAAPVQPPAAAPAKGRGQRQPGPAGQLTLAYHRRLLHLAGPRRGRRRHRGRDGRGARGPRRRGPRCRAWRSPALSCPRTPRESGSPSWRWASAAPRELNYASDVDVNLRRRAVPSRCRQRRADRRGWPLKTATRLAAGLIRACERTTPEGSLFPVDPKPAARGPPGTARPLPGQPPRLLRAVGEDLGVPGAAQGPPRGRRPGPLASVHRRADPAGLGGVAAGELRRGRCRRCAAASSTRCRRTWRAAS